jgi:hypothetical protein
MVEDIEKFDWAKKVLRVARNLVKFITKWHKVLAM